MRISFQIKSLDKTFIASVAKRDGVSSTEDLRLISLIYHFYKLVSKVQALGLKLVPNDVADDLVTD